MGDRFNTPTVAVVILLSICAILLTAVFLRLEMVHDQVSAPHDRRLCGQVVTSYGVATERYYGESITVWEQRHMEAVRTFKTTQEGGR